MCLLAPQNRERLVFPESKTELIKNKIPIVNIPGANPTMINLNVS